MESEYSIKPSFVLLTDSETRKIDSTNIEKSHVLEIKETDNLYEYLKCNKNFRLVYNNELEMNS